MNLKGKHIILDDFDATVMVYCIYEAKLDYEDRKKDPDIKKPNNLLRNKWLALEEMVYTYFTTMKISQGVLLE